MNKADKMFEKLGYEKQTLIGDVVYVKCEGDVGNIEMNKVYFDLDRKTCSVTDDYGYAGDLNGDELWAVQEKMKELGWLDEK